MAKEVPIKKLAKPKFWQKPDWNKHLRPSGIALVGYLCNQQRYFAEPVIWHNDYFSERTTTVAVCDRRESEPTQHHGTKKFGFDIISGIKNIRIPPFTRHAQVCIPDVGGGVAEAQHRFRNIFD